MQTQTARTARHDGDLAIEREERVEVRKLDLFFGGHDVLSLFPPAILLSE